MVVPGVVGPDAPCHEIVQPPDWMPDVVGARSREQDVAPGRRQRQQPWGRLEQHRRLPDRLAGDRPMRVRADLVVRLGRHRVLEQAHLELDGQDPRHGVVDPRLGRSVPAGEPGLDGRLEARAVVGDHDHVDAGRDRLRDGGGVVGARPGRPRAQSETTKPVNPSSPLRTSVSRWWSPWTLPAPVLENDAMTIRAPAARAASYGARWIVLNVSSSMSGTTPWSIE